MSSSSRRRALSGMGTRTLCMSRGVCTTPSATDPDLGTAQSSHDKFQENLRRAGVADVVDCRRAFSHEVARDWTRPIRLLWIDGDHVYEAVKRDLALFRPHLAPGAIVAMHDVLGTWPTAARVRRGRAGLGRLRARGLLQVDRL